MRIGVIGVGSIGSVLAEGFRRLGHTVVIHDKDEQREQALDLPAVPMDVLVSQCELAVIAVPTPTGEHGGDASAVESVIHHIDSLASDVPVCIRSTMPPGETGRLAQEYDVEIVYSPEFLRDRSDVEDFFDPDRIVLAGPAHVRGLVRSALDDPSIDCDTVIRTDDYLTAEIGKEAHNAFFATKVSFANQIRLICEQEGADASTVMDIVTADHRNTSSHLDPLLGPYGGKCLPKDTRALTLYAEQQGAPTDQLRGTINVNQVAREKYEDAEIAGEWPHISVEGD